MSSNTCNSSATGLSLSSSDYNTISGNTCNSNTLDGIYITGSSYNTISSNTLTGNDSNTVNAQAGLYITSNSDFNTMSSNSVNNNNNSGAGTGYGIYIATASCDENVVASNNANGNDIDISDAGVGTTITYYVQNADELQDAIDSIGSKAGNVHITNGSITISTTIDVDSGGSITISGGGDGTILTAVNNVEVFNITSAASLLVEKLKIDANAYTANTSAVIINEGSNNIIAFENVTIDGDGTNGYGIDIRSDSCIIDHCTISDLARGVFLNACDKALISFNDIDGNVNGIYLDAADENIIDGNTIKDNTLNGMYITGSDKNAIQSNMITGSEECAMYFYDSAINSIFGNIIYYNNSNCATSGGGIKLGWNCDNFTIIGNNIYNNYNQNAGYGYGVWITVAQCNNNIVRGNSVTGNDYQLWDDGTNTDIEYRVSNALQLQNAVDSIGSKSGLIHIVSGSFTLYEEWDDPFWGTYVRSTTIDIDGGGEYVIEGEGSGTIITLGRNIPAFNITNAKSCVLKNFSIDADSLTLYSKELIIIDEASDNTVIIDGVTIVGDGTNGYGIEVNSDNCIVRNCDISAVDTGIITVAASNTKIVNNTITSNDVNTANVSGGIIIGANSDNNIISENTCNNSNNAGAGIAYGIYIAAATCNNNIVKDNYVSGNDIQSWDAGTNTDIKYRVSDEDELQDAIDSIAAKSGIIHIISGTLTLTADIDVDGGGDYIIEGEGDGTVIDVGGDWAVFTITSAKSCVLRNFKIDANDIASDGTTIIAVAEGSDYPVTIDNVTIDGATKDKGFGISIASSNVTVKNCEIDDLYSGIVVAAGGSSDIFINDNSIHNCANYGISLTIASSNCIVARNHCYDNTNDGISISVGFTNSILSENICNGNQDGITVYVSNRCVMSNNIAYGNSQHGIFLSACTYSSITSNICNENDSNSASATAGIYLTAACIRNTITGNTCLGNNNAGAGDAYGIYIADAGSIANSLANNVLDLNDVAYNDSGTTTVLHGDDTAYGASWNGNLGTATKNAIFDKIETVGGAGSDKIYYCDTYADWLAAIADIDGNNYNGRIILCEDMTMTIAGVISDANASYTVEGLNDNITITTTLLLAAFAITACQSCTIKNLTIDCSSFAIGVGTAITVVGGSDIRIENVRIVGGGDGKGISLDVAAHEVKIIGCEIDDVDDGIYVDTTDNIIMRNYIHDIDDDGIHLDANTDRNLVIGNTLRTIGDDGILIIAGATDNVLYGNIQSAITGNEVTDGGTNTDYTGTVHTRQIGTVFAQAINGETAGNDNVWNAGWAITHGKTSKTTGGYYSAHFFRLPKDYVSGEDFDIILSMYMAGGANPDTIDYDIDVSYNSSGSPHVANEFSEDATWTHDYSANKVWHETVTVTGTNFSAEDFVYVILYMEDDSNGNNIYLFGVALEIPVNTRD